MKKLRLLISVFVLLMSKNSFSQEFEANGIKYGVNPNNASEVYVAKGDYKGDIVIPAEVNGYHVSAIADNAFNGCEELTSISIPEGMKTIGREAFANCKNITSITIPTSVTEIGYCAFYECPLRTLNYNAKDAKVTENERHQGSPAFSTYLESVI